MKYRISQNSIRRFNVNEEDADFELCLKNGCSLKKQEWCRQKPNFMYQFCTHVNKNYQILKEYQKYKNEKSDLNE